MKHTDRLLALLFFLLALGTGALAGLAIRTAKTGAPVIPAGRSSRSMASHDAVFHLLRPSNLPHPLLPYSMRPAEKLAWQAWSGRDGHTVVREVMNMRRLIPAIGLLGLMGSFLWNAPAAAQAARDALALCARSVIPALFPFFVAMSCFTSLGLARETGRLLAPLAAPLLGCSGTGAAAFLLGLLV